jgi:small GTP-binding protein
MLKLKVLVAGAKDVGKTTLIKRFVTGTFQINTLSTIGVDFMTKNLTVDQTDVHLSLWDFAGESKFRVLLPSYCAGASGALLLFDITSRASFDELRDWVELLNKSTGKSMVSKLLIGSKADLADARQVSQEEAIAFQNEYGMMNYLECSSKTGQNVEDIFESMTRGILTTNLKRCPFCNEYIVVDQLFCQFCGRKFTS